MAKVIQAKFAASAEPAPMPRIPRTLLASAGDSVLVLIDIQERLAAAMEPAVLSKVMRNGRILLQAAARLGVPVLLTEQYPKGLGPTVAGLAEVLPRDATPLEKTSFSCTDSEPFRSALEASGREQTILSGMEAHVCVLQTAIELRAAGRDVFVVEDACSSRDRENHANAMHRLRQAGVLVTNTESLVFEWLRDARHEHFKAVSALLR